MVPSYIVCRLDSKLADMERRFGVAVRWAPTDKDYVDTKRLVMSNRRDQIHTCLWALVVKRHYDTILKAKYAGGGLLCMHNI